MRERVPSTSYYSIVLYLYYITRFHDRNYIEHNLFMSRVYLSDQIRWCEVMHALFFTRCPYIYVCKRTRRKFGLHTLRGMILQYDDSGSLQATILYFKVFFLMVFLQFEVFCDTILRFYCLTKTWADRW